MKYATTLNITVDDVDDRQQAFQGLLNAAGDMSTMFPNIAVNSYQIDEVLEREVGEEYFDDYTLFKVVNALREAGVEDAQAETIINTLQNAGILFRERA